MSAGKCKRTDERWSDPCERQAVSTPSAGSAVRASVFHRAVGFLRGATAGPAEKTWVRHRPSRARRLRAPGGLPHPLLGCKRDARALRWTAGSPCRAEVSPAQKGSRPAAPPSPAKGPPKGPEPQQPAAPSKGKGKDKGKESKGAGHKGAQQSPRPGKGKGWQAALQTPAAWLRGREAALAVSRSVAPAPVLYKAQSTGSAKGTGQDSQAEPSV